MSKENNTVKEIRNPEQFIEELKSRNLTDIVALIRKHLLAESIMEIDSKIKELDKLKGWLDSFRPLEPLVVQEMKKNYDVRFTYNSNAIEGNTLTQNETELVLEKGITIGGKSLNEHLEVTGHKDAIDFIEELASSNTPITEREIKDIHSIIIRGINKKEAGAYRQIDVRASGTDYIYPPHYRIGELMEELVLWLQKEGKKLHPVEFAAQAHYKFITIHPFRDGNGRSARLLMNLILLRYGYPIAVISNEHRKDYIDSLIHAQSQNDDTSHFLEVMIDAEKESLLDYLRIVSTVPGNTGKGEAFYKEIETAFSS